MVIERKKNEVIFRLTSKLNIEELQDITDFFAWMEITKKSKAKQSDVDKLVRQIKKGRWKRTKALLAK